MKLFTNSKTFSLFQFDKESDFEKEVAANYKQFFGINTIYIDAKRKIETKSLGNSIPDGFLFDLSDKDNPEFYIVEVELAKHDFYNHIFPQITKFFGFFKNPKSQNDLIEKIFSIITNNNEIKNEFKKHLGEKEIYKFIKDTIEQSQNILLIIDDEKKELPEIMETYIDTWGKMVKLIFIKKFFNESDIIYIMHPDFANIEFAEIENEISADVEDFEYNEEYHFEGVSETVRKIYNEIKTDLLKSYPDIIFNPKKYYISIRKEKNIAYFTTRKNKIRLIITQSDNDTRNEIKNHSVKTLSSSVQKFYNNPCCAIMINRTDNLDEIKNLLKKLIAKTNIE